MSDLESNAVKALMQSKDLHHIMERMYRYRFEGDTWEDRFAWGCDKLMELGLESFEHPTLPRTVVAFMHGTRRKRPACIVLGMSAVNAEIPSAIDKHVGSGLIQLIPKGVIDVTVEGPC